MKNSPRLRLFVAIVLALGALVTLIWALSRRQRPGTLAPVAQAESPHTIPSVIEPEIASPSPTTQPSIEPTPQASINQPEASPQPSASVQPSPNAPVASLLIPVAGVRPEQLRDTFSEARSMGRTH